jgi:CRISPR-associated protein (TIGR02584 family)
MKLNPKMPKPDFSAVPSPVCPYPGSLHTILLAVTGMSPAVLTETIWALAQEEPAFVPNRVAVVTTIAGRQALERELLETPSPGSPSVWQELRRAILGPECDQQERLILEPPRLVEAPNPRTGRADWLEDLRTPGDNAATANFLLAEVRRWTELPDTRLVVSIAGGRKTMGALLCACVSILGRERDRLTHVLVDEPFDDPRLKPKFYFPVQSRQELLAADGKRCTARRARIHLADIPFVPLRNLFERDLVRKPSTFVEFVERCRRQVDVMARATNRLVLWRSKLQVAVNGCVVSTSAREHLLLLFLAERARAGLPPLPSYAAAFADFNEFCQRTHAGRVADDFSDWRHEANQSLDFGEMERFCIRVKSQLKEKLRRAGAEAVRLLALLPKAKRFSLDLPPGAIIFKD